MVNVLQAMLLTDGPRMVRTPTYWAFDLYKDYGGGTVLPVDIDAPRYAKNAWTMKTVSASAVKGVDGALHIGMTNVDPTRPIAVTVRLDDVAGGSVTGRILTAGAMDAHNVFGQPETVRPAAFAGATLTDHVLRLTLPAKAIVMLDVR